jgi:hypothetical protein
MNGPVILTARLIDGLKEDLSAPHDRPGRGGRHKDEVALEPGFCKSIFERLFDMHEVIEPAELGETK